MTTAIQYRRALPGDAPACVDLRGRTRENAFSAAQLAELGITAESWAEGIRDDALPGHIALDGERMAGYCFGDREGGEIVVLALLPAYEGQGIGRRLLDLSIADLVDAGHTRLILGCAADPAVRSHGFYRHLGWRPTGEIDALGDEVLELQVGTAP